MRGNHIIDKQTVDLSIQRVEDFHPVADRLQELLYHQVYPQLSDEMDRLCDDESTITIQRVEIDLGVIRSVDEANIADLIVREISRKLRSSIQILAGRSVEHGVAIVQSDVYSWRLWCKYLKTGVMPSGVRPELNQEELERVLLKGISSSYREEIINIIRETLIDKHAAKRLSIVFSLQFIEEIAIATSIMIEDHVEIKQMIRELVAYTKIDHLVIERVFWEYLLTNRGDDPTIFFVGFINALVLKYSNKDWHEILTKWMQGRSESSRSISNQGSINAFLKLLLSTTSYSDFRELSRKAFSAVVDKISSSAFEVIQSKGTISFMPRTQSSDSVRSSTSSPLWRDRDADLKEPIYTKHAGLVITASFLPHFFEAVGLIRNDRFINIHAQEEAVRLAGFLATGDVGMSDWELLVPKILCGLPIDHPISSDEILDDMKLDEGVTLLRSIISHWNVLGDSSVDGLRQGFLQRDGKLTQQENGEWLLQVEKRTIDILLDRLPWGFGMIRHSWMRGMLTTEWV
ncbi:MAG: contractile injection system tape measure protein [Bacteroidota bacterium]